jgi:hypothetical protein
MSDVDVDAAVKALTAFGEAAHELGEAEWTIHAS